MTFSHFNRRIHLYLGLSLLPWLLMYGVSSLPFAHNQFFEQRDRSKGLPLWTLRAEYAVDLPVPQEAHELRRFGRALLEKAGIVDTARTSFGVYRQSAAQINVYCYSFWKSTQLKYFVDQKRLTVEDRRFRWDQFLTGMHARGGFEQEAVLQRSWSIVVDVVCVAIVVWICTGLYMWWGLPGCRRWGLAAIAGGVISFVVFTLRL
jgi:hypothetical protein